MKKKRWMMIFAVVLTLTAVGCGNAEGNGEKAASSSEPPKQVIEPKELTQEAAYALEMAGINDATSTGLLHYQGPTGDGEQIKSVTLKLMEYSSKTQKWDCIRKFHMGAGESGDLLVSFSDDGTRIYVKVAASGGNSSEQGASGLKAIPQMKDSDTGTYEQMGSVPLELDKDIALYMALQAKDGPDLKSPDLKAYPDPGAYKDYSYIRAVVANFSTVPLDQ